MRERGQGPVFIWAHGLTSSIRTEDALGMFHWNDFPADVRLIRYDARGHGRSEPSFEPADYQWNSLAGDMLAIADRLAIEVFTAGGQSMGCGTTIHAALDHPDRIDRMVLMNPPTAWETRARQARLYRRLAKIGGAVGGSAIARLISMTPDRFVPTGFLGEGANPKGVLEGWRPIGRKALSTIFTGAALADLPPRARIESIAVPALILAWPEDPAHPVETAAELDRLLPRSRLHVAESATDVRRWPRLIRDFVRGSD